ncbi:hypothetical protein JZ751_023413 [Albula glossodonta]|uniref:Uncharacterized protein n=1 Tax=Albula glossodonta TaxID=121402 RepID=A0A8T2NH64_9TELE|nr:hypothetical protein JZ751_023413 [Albula glossodonta]
MRSLHSNHPKTAAVDTERNVQRSQAGSRRKRGDPQMTESTAEEQRIEGLATHQTAEETRKL